MKKNNIISDWLDKYGDPEIDKKVEIKLEEMNKEKQQQIIDEAYENYENAYYKGHAFGYKKLNDNEFSPDLKISKEDFINICKTNPEFSEKWGLKIEERIVLEQVDQTNPTLKGSTALYSRKLITLTYNNETVESYE